MRWGWASRGSQVAWEWGQTLPLLCFQKFSPGCLGPGGRVLWLRTRWRLNFKIFSLWSEYLLTLRFVCCRNPAIQRPEWLQDHHPQVPSERPQCFCVWRLQLWNESLGRKDQQGNTHLPRLAFPRELPWQFEWLGAGQHLYIGPSRWSNYHLICNQCKA